MTVSYLDLLGQSLLDAAEAALVLATTGHDPPGLAYLSHGPPVADACDDGLIAVHLASVTHEPVQVQGANVQCCVLLPTSHWQITLMRCVPGLSDSPTDPFPSETDLDTSAGDLLIDLWALLTELYDRLASGMLAEECCDVSIGEVLPLEPSGRVAGWTVGVDVVCNDAGPLGS